MPIKPILIITECDYYESDEGYGPQLNDYHIHPSYFHTIYEANDYLKGLNDDYQLTNKQLEMLKNKRSIQVRNRHSRYDDFTVTKIMLLMPSLRQQ